jgi:hypothetical protein
MKKAILIFPICLIIITALSCTMPEENTKKGLVEFYDSPGYDTSLDEIFFTAIFQYADYTTGKAVEIEYQVLDGTTVITSGSALADTYSASGVFWFTDEITAPVSQEQYGGKTITIFLDPAGKLTADPYLSPELDGRQETVIIPVP